jgi:hypothetical protein
MNPTAIFSKSGKGVQEASGKTSQLSRPDRAVLSVIDGRATLADVAHKVGKQFDNEFKSLITKLDKDGFIREVSPGAAAPAGKSAAAAPARPASKPTAPMDMASDLDFTAAMAAQPRKGAAAPPPQNVARAPAPPPKPTVAVPPAPPPPTVAEKAKQAVIAKEQQSAFAKAREEAERKQQEDRDRVKSEAEAKVRAETETKLRAEAEEKAKADAEAKARKAEADAAAARSSAIRAAAAAKVRAEAEAKRAREEAERARQEAERARKEAEEKARREQEELKRKLEEERRAREEAERKAKEEAERARRELEEERRKMEEERKRLEEEQRREEEERAARRRREEEEEAQRAAQRKLREEEEERERAEKEAARKREADEQSLEKMMAAQAAPAAPPAAPPPPPKPKAAATGDAFADSLLADLDSFTQRDDEERKAKEDAERKAKEEVTRKRQEEVARAEREEQEARQREEDERRRKEEEKQRARDEEERRALKQREEQEQAEREAEERRRKMASASPAAAGGDDIGITDDDLELDEVKREAALLEKKKNRKEEREKEREKERTQKKERDREAKSKKEKEKEEKESKKASAAYRPRRKSNLGRNLVVGLFLLLIAGVGVMHVLPVSTTEYERTASEALGLPVKIASGRFSMIGGVQYKFEGVSIGEFSVPLVRAYPEIGSVFGDKKVFTRIELEGMSLPQEALGDALFAKAKGDGLTVSQVTLRNLKLSGALPLPPLDAEVQLQGGGVRTATVRGPEGLVAKLGAKDQAIEFDVNTAQFTLPFAQGITLVQFAMKGDATRQGMKINQWDGLLFSGHVTGTASVRWGNTWSVDGVLTARGVNAAVFAPALMSNGRAEGTGRFSMSGVEPAKLGSSARLEGSFTVSKGVLGSFDLSRALQTGGRQVTGQTQFAEMSGQGTYDRGAVSLRNINLGAGALNAGASADISESGALSGRIVADVKTSTQNLRSTLILGGTIQEPQVRN